jgi:GntR family transcriptional repressor for pyruvate dehydrogenase complex
VTESEWRPISRMRTHEQVLAEIEQRLRSGGLRAGDRLPPERQLAEALGVSRGAVREALRILEAMGVVEAGTGSGPAAGSIIVNDSTSGLSMVLRMHLQSSSLRHDDLVEVRVALERLAVRKVTAEPDEQGLAHLREIVEQMRSPQSTSEYNELDIRFHTQLGTMSGNELLPVLMTSLRVALRRTMVSAFEGLDDPGGAMTQLTAEHAAIVDAVAAPDGDLAVKLVTSHITAFYHRMDFTEPL